MLNLASGRMKGVPFMKNIVQLNSRVRPPYKRAAKFTAGVTGQSIDRATEMVWRYFVGQEDEETREAREKVLKTWKVAGERLPFNLPGVAPFGHESKAA